MTQSVIYLLYFVGVIVSWIIFYYVVKAAVKNGIKEARAENLNSSYNQYHRPERIANPAQILLQQRYDKGEISFETYQSEWNKLSS